MLLAKFIIIQSDHVAQVHQHSQLARGASELRDPTIAPQWVNDRPWYSGKKIVDYRYNVVVFPLIY